MVKNGWWRSCLSYSYTEQTASGLPRLEAFLTAQYRHSCASSNVREARCIMSSLHLGLFCVTVLPIRCYQYVWLIPCFGWLHTSMLAFCGIPTVGFDFDKQAQDTHPPCHDALTSASQCGTRYELDALAHVGS